MRFLARANFVRGLRFRLTLTNSIFLIGLLIGLGFFFRGVLSRILDNQVRDILNEEWAAVKGYLIIHKRVPDWQFDSADEEEAFIVQRLQRVSLITDSKGKVLKASPIYEDLGVQSPKEIVTVLKSKEPFWVDKRSSDGELFRIRGGVFVDDTDNEVFFVAIGRSLAQNERTLAEFTNDYIRMLPWLLISGTLLGWFVSKRALRPVDNLAHAAARMSSSNLNLRIPLRNAGDELDNLIQTFNSMVERLEQSFLMTRQFSTDVSHELRTPLTAIRGQLEVALFTAATKEQYREAIITALEDVERLGQTIRAMLMLSQAESGQLVLQKAPLDLGLIIEDIVEQFQIPAEEAKLQVTAEVRGLVMMEADRIQIERMLNNLVSNAIKYTPPGGHVVVRVSVEGESVLLEVADTGVGIAPEYLPHIFDRFYRVPGSSKEKQGLGLGLSFVAWIVKAHNGTVETTSEKGKGTRFAITLPAMPLTAPYATPAMLEAGLPEAQPPTAPQAPA